MDYMHPSLLRSKDLHEYGVELHVWREWMQLGIIGEHQAAQVAFSKGMQLWVSGELQREGVSILASHGTCSLCTLPMADTLHNVHATSTVSIDRL